MFVFVVLISDRDYFIMVQNKIWLQIASKPTMINREVEHQEDFPLSLVWTALYTGGISNHYIVKLNIDTVYLLKAKM